MPEADLLYAERSGGVRQRADIDPGGVERGAGGPLRIPRRPSGLASKDPLHSPVRSRQQGGMGSVQLGQEVPPLTHFAGMLVPQPIEQVGDLRWESHGGGG